MKRSTCGNIQKTHPIIVINFKDNWKNDLQSMILRDRNHPSVIAWSIGNEIYERADTSGQRIASQLVRVVKSLDNSRPLLQQSAYSGTIPV